MDPTRLSLRTRDALDKLPPEKRRRAEAVITRTQTPEARARDAADRAILDQEYRDSGRIATVGTDVDPQDAAAFASFIATLRQARESRAMSLEQLAARSKLDEAALSRLETGKQANPTVAILMRYAQALGMRVTFYLTPRSGAGDASPSST